LGLKDSIHPSQAILLLSTPQSGVKEGADAAMLRIAGME
jgi:hypothetical protein